MKTKIHPAPALAGSYDLRPMETVALHGAQSAQIGMVRIGAGTRSPAEGLRAGARHEIAYLVSGRVQVDTADGSRVIEADSVIVSSPTEAHATTALSDATLMYVLIDPAGAPR
ncbi:MAG: hypothetical protein JSS24_01360 [Proteobacteria bacterium]|nr:hypothetical protein [Pseudomonadota bacterium]